MFVSEIPEQKFHVLGDIVRMGNSANGSVLQLLFHIRKKVNMKVITQD